MFPRKLTLNTNAAVSLSISLSEWNEASVEDSFFWQLLFSGKGLFPCARQGFMKNHKTMTDELWSLAHEDTNERMC